MSHSPRGNALPAGYRLREYRIDSVLGHGGFGITYAATDMGLQRPVAIKEYLPSELAVRERDATVRPFTEERASLFAWGLESFLAEARTLARLDHRSIVRVLAVFEQNGTAYMVMPLEEGRSLADLVRFDSRRDEASLLRILHALLDGLEHVHDAGFIHRDIKPDNIFVRADGSPVLLDFGSARLSVGTRASTQMTSLVTPGFAPYEQYHGDAQRQGPWTDIYGLGATFYAAMSRGRPPVDALARSHARIDGSPDPLEPAAVAARGEFGESFLAAIDAALRFLPEERPRSVSVWRAMLPAAVREEAPAEDAATRLNDTSALSAPVTSEPGADQRHEAGPGDAPVAAQPTDAAGPRVSDLEGFGAGERETSSGHLVFGLLTFWAWTALRLGGRVLVHADDRKHWFRAVLVERAESEPARALLGCAFDPWPCAPRAFALVYVADGLAVVTGFVAFIMLRVEWTVAAQVWAVAIVSLVFYANTLAFVAWLWRFVKGHERAERKLLELADDPATFAAQRPVLGFADRWEPMDNRLTLFLVVACPLTFSPALGMYLFHQQRDLMETSSLPLAVFACGALFHLWGTRLLLSLWNGHLSAEAQALTGRRDSGDVTGGAST